jgi:hypothetical protein
VQRSSQVHAGRAGRHCAPIARVCGVSGLARFAAEAPRLTRLARTGKDYDPTAAAREEKERREKRHKEAMEKKERKEMESCTFKPAVSRRSMELLQTVQKDRPSLHSPVRTPSRMSYKGPELQVQTHHPRGELQMRCASLPASVRDSGASVCECLRLK